ncbi:MAG: hypothetical protein HKN76_15235, partial [Saprospiraceae bacterium]|nr:hypothetical protein [Saprospiraceae bacterium]
LLQRDGNLVAADGTSDLTLKIGKGQYYLALNHRNHLGMMSAGPISMGYTATTPIDASLLTFTTYGINATKTMSGKQVMWTGDADATGIIDSGDRGATWNNRNDQSYNLSDCSLDGITDSADRGITWNNRNLIEQLPN